MTDNAHFPNPPVDLKTLATAIDDLSAAMAAQVQGGTASTALKKNKRATIIDLLGKLAHCGNNPAVVPGHRKSAMPFTTGFHDSAAVPAG